MKLFRYLLAILLPAVAFSSCRQEAIPDTVPADGKYPLTWRVNVSTKSAASLDTDALKTTPFGVQAYWTDKGLPYKSTSSAALFLDNRKVVYNSTDDLWECDPKAWWVLGKQISFFAYAPWVASKADPTDPDPYFVFDDTDPQVFLRGSFSQFDDPAQQKDLLIASPMLDQFMGALPAPVPLTFKHALSKILVYLNITGDTEGHKFKLKSMSLGNIAGSGAFNYNTSAGGFTWDEIPRSNTAVRNKTYNLSIDDATLEDAYIPHVDDLPPGATGLARYLRVQTANKGELMMLPQPLTTTSELILRLDAYREEPASSGNWVYDSSEAPFDLILPAENSWEAGNVYCYTITLDVTHHYIIQFGITITPWGSYSQTISYPE